MAEKIWGGYVTSISVKNFNVDKFILFKIPAGYKKMTNCLKCPSKHKNDF